SIVFVQQAFFQQKEVGILALRTIAAHIDIDGIITHLDRKRIQVIAAAGEAAAAFHVVAPSVPVTSQDSVANAAACQRIPHVRTLVIRCIEVSLVLKQRDTASSDLNGFGSAFTNIFNVGHSDKGGLHGRHRKLLYRTLWIPETGHLAVSFQTRLPWSFL